jgi:alkanesulfonate monooxygenase SsuD/methylene tetrahydromethanopterin reductase-like flavin-dependent oxidoreductase (luciferase family)
MDVGIQLVFGAAGWDDLTDSELYRQELELARMADALGFDAVWPVEHHFFDYSVCPDNTELLAYLAAATPDLDLGTAAVIMPWNEPLRVAEKISMLDNLSGGRVRFGMGRGLSRREYVPFRGVEMAESRGRFDEGAAMVVEALRTGFIEGDGPYYPQPRTEIRPRPERDFSHRLYAVAGSDDSIDSAARIGARMVMFAEKEWTRRRPGVDKHAALFQELHGTPPPPPLTADFTLCSTDTADLEDRARRYMGGYLASLLEHYELMNDHFSETEGYEGYGKNAEVLRKVGEAGFLKGFMASNAYGTPDQILATFQRRREDLGPFELATSFRYGGIPFDEARASLELFAAEVLPVLKTWD